MFNARSVLVSVATLALLAGAASAQVDAQAKSTLEQSAKAIKANTGMSFKVKRWMDGMPMLKYGGEASVKFARTATPATTLGFYLKGKTEIPGQGEQNVEVLTFDGKWVTWVDEAKKTVFQHPMVQNTEGAGVIFRTKTTLLPPPLIDDEPFATELKAGKIVMEPAKDIAGEACQVIRVVLKDGDAERLIYISAVDNLPRRYEQIKIMSPGKTMAPVWEMSDLKAEKVDLASIKIETPKGFTLDKREAVAPATPAAQPSNPASPKTVGNVLPTGGLRAGAEAPAFELGTVPSGDKVSLAGLKGNTVVLTFWGTKFKDSMEMLPILEQVGKSFAGKSVKVFSIASREESADAVTKWAESSKPAVPCLLGAQATSDAYGVRGFPSTFVLDGEGKVVKFFEGAVDATKLTEAVEAAMKAGK